MGGTTEVYNQQIFAWQNMNGCEIYNHMHHLGYYSNLWMYVLQLCEDNGFTVVQCMQPFAETCHGALHISVNFM